MPSRNAVKQFVADSYWHVYNRGVEKRVIFLDKQDYATFLWLLKRYLSLRPGKNLEPSPLSSKIVLLAYCLMPNHFHLELWQKNKSNITEFMRVLSNSYVAYFNQKYNRVGTLFQGVYRGLRIEHEDQLLHLSRYIHLNPGEIGQNLFCYPYSSIRNYLGEQKTDWLNTEIILNYFDYQKRKTSLPREYENFLSKRYHRPGIIKSLILD